MPREQSQAAIHCPHAYTRGSKPNIRYSKSIHTTAHPVSAARAHTVAGTRSYVRALVARPRSSVRPLRATCGTPPDAGWRRHNDCAQDGRQTQSTRRTGAPKRSVTNDTASARAHTHTSLRDDVDGVGLELGGRWPARKSSSELEEQGPQSCTGHLGRGGTL